MPQIICFLCDRELPEDSFQTHLESYHTITNEDIRTGLLCDYYKKADN